MKLVNKYYKSHSLNKSPRKKPSIRKEPSRKKPSTRKEPISPRKYRRLQKKKR